MTWSVELSPQARDELARLPKKDQRMIAKALDRMEEDPFAGNVKPLIRRLVLATVERVERLHFRTGEGIQLSGWDRAGL